MKEEVQALAKYERISPAKIRQITRIIQGKQVEEAIELLRFIPRKSARLVAKALKSAVANAENNHNMPSDQLIIKKALAEEGPTFKRFRPAARGSAHPYRKKTTHIRIVLAPEFSK